MSKMTLVENANSVDLLLIGKTGNGKSALGNALLQKEVFVSVGDVCSVTFDINYEYSEFKDRKLKIVDSPGIGDTRLKKEKGTEHIMKALEYAIKINPVGYHAFLIVLKYGNRFTTEESEAIMFLKKNFGKDFVKNFCIIVMTGGDNFEHDNKKENLKEYFEWQAKFLSWCKNQNVDEFQELLKECNSRIILFNNRAQNVEILNEQVAHLLQMVDNLSLSGKRYTNAHFEAVKNARDQLILEAKEPMIRDETMRDTSLILDRLKKIVAIEDLTKRMKKLLDVSDSVQNLYDSIQKQDKGTGVLHELVNYVGNIQSQIRKEEQCVITKKEENERNRTLNEENIRRHQMEMQKLKEQADKELKEKQIALENANKINEEKRKAHEAELKKQQEEREKKIEELKKQQEEQRKLGEETKQRKKEIERLHEAEIKRLKNEAEQKIKEEKIAMEKANQEIEEKRKNIEEELRLNLEEQKRKKEEWEKEQAEKARQLQKEQEAEKERHEREMEDLRKQFSEVKAKSDESLFHQLGEVIKMLANAVGEFIVERFTKAFKG